MLVIPRIPIGHAKPALQPLTTDNRSLTTAYAVTNAPLPANAASARFGQPKAFGCADRNSCRYAADALDHGRQYAFRDRKTKKRNFRALWQIRINAAARAAGITYSRFMEGLKAAQVALDRKILADLAATDGAAFAGVIQIVQNALKTKAARLSFGDRFSNGRPGDAGRPFRFAISVISSIQIELAEGIADLRRKTGRAA